MTSRSLPKCSRTVLALGAAGLAVLLGCRAGAQAPATPKPPPPLTPGGVYRAHDPARPQPRIVTPGEGALVGGPPSDAVILFDGRDLSAWEQDQAQPDKTRKRVSPPNWLVRDGYFEVLPRSGSISSKARFGDCQIHLEWATPEQVVGSGQGRGNSGLFISGHPEIQLLDSFQNTTYPDGQAGALYGLYPPLVNASRPPGAWQTYEVIYRAPRFDANRRKTDTARYTIFHNGVVLHNAIPVPGDATQSTLGLQDHNNPMRFRNIWVRPLGDDDPAGR